MATKYESGRAFEYTCKKKLEKLGYYVIRSAGSKGVADLVAIPIIDRRLWDDDYRTLVVQCKNNGKISKAEKEQLENMSIVLADVHSIFAYKNKSRRTVFEDAVSGEQLFTEETK